MAKQITLEEIRHLLEKGKPDKELLKTVDAIMGLIVFFAPLAVGLPPGTADVVAKVLEKREGLFKVGEVLVEKLAKLGAGDEVDRYRRIEAAHLLITYSSFFDSVSKKIPDFWKKLALDETAQKYLAQQSKGEQKALTRLGTLPPQLPHPLATFETHLSELRSFYEALNKTLVGYLEVLKIANIDASAKANEYGALKESITADALERYQAQYVELATKFPEFHIFANFHFQISIDERLRGFVEAAASSGKEIDLGFQKLAEAISLLGREPASKTLADLRKLYLKNSERPISEKGVPGLTFPRRCDIFVPQAYRALRYRSGMRLDDEKTWSGIPPKEDLGLFLERCVESPVSIEKPILILGAPGSGKSMLTHMIGSVLGGRFDTIRIELNKVNPDSRIHTQIKDFVSDETGGRQITWPDLRDEFKAPPVVILDGFDELLQATGKVFAAYIEDCEEFQAENLTYDRPVRTIITSRMTLINRAHIPEDTIVIRLEEFDSRRRMAWAEVWNRHNQTYFSDSGKNTKPFNVKALHQEVRHLSKQPLLLLMLAIYDAVQNRLASQGQLNRTALYHSLIRDFVEREEKRTKGFGNLTSGEQQERIEKQMRRLGLAGLSMFNHRRREVRPSDVRDVLAVFQLTYPMGEEGQRLGQAEKLFGSFFFVLKSERVHSEDIVYEFLHPTFGEFLAAYTIAQELVESCEYVPQKPAARNDYVRKPDAFPTTWFECFIHAPLFNEPVVLAMFREWLPQVAGDKSQLIIQQLRSIVSGQAAMLLEGARFPDPFKVLPALGHAAIYSVNLVTMAAVLGNEALIFDETEFQSYSDETRPWDRLTFLWRSWFSLRVLANINVFFKARREESKILIQRADESHFRNTQTAGLDRLYAAASGIGDHVLLGLSGYFLADSVKNSQPTLNEVDKHLGSEGYTLGVFSSFRRIPLNRGPESYKSLMEIVRDPNVPHWETWLRAIWIVTANQDCVVNWTSIPMVRELHRSSDHLIAPIAHPDDAQEFYSEHDHRPIQLWFAKKSGGKERYRDTYERLKSEIAKSEWLTEEYVLMREAAEYFSDKETVQILSKMISKVALFNDMSKDVTGLLGVAFTSLVPRARALSSAFYDLWVPAILNRWSFLTMARWSSFQSHKISKWWAVFSKKSQYGMPRLDNPYQQGFADYLRMLKTKGEGKDYIRFLTTCADLSADVQIELMDIVRTLPDDKPVPELRASFDFPLNRIGEITLNSLAAAKHVAKWLGNEKAGAEISRFLGGD
jgi:adenylate kinase family enzyme